MPLFKHVFSVTRLILVTMVTLFLFANGGLAHSLVPIHAQSCTTVVSDASDSGTTGSPAYGSLRYALSCAHPGDTITFAPTLRTRLKTTPWSSGINGVIPLRAGGMPFDIQGSQLR
ncbi:MAG: hypothetical protein ACYDEO_23360, partial [Aggregatilineales bacterium]